MTTSTGFFIIAKLGCERIYSDSGKMNHMLIVGALFFSDFVSHWFQVHSAYSSGDASHKGKNKNENIILWMYYNTHLLLFLCLAAEIYTGSFYFTYFKEEFSYMLNHPFYLPFMYMCTAGALLKNGINVV